MQKKPSELLCAYRKMLMGMQKIEDREPPPIGGAKKNTRIRRLNGLYKQSFRIRAISARLLYHQPSAAL
jgi:hypothetical protein